MFKAAYLPAVRIATRAYRSSPRVKFKTFARYIKLIYRRRGDKDVDVPTLEIAISYK